MKTILMSCLLTLPLFAAAESAPIQTLTCAELGSGGGSGVVYVELDPNAFDSGSGIKEPTSARLYYEFSGVNKMVCDGLVHQDNFDVNCVGYYSGREITELKIRTVDGNTTAYWQTSRIYGNKPMQTACVLK